MKRRAFITLFGGAAAVVWPFATRAEGDRQRLIGVLSAQAEGDPDMAARLAGFRQVLSGLGWSEDRSRIEPRFAASSVEQFSALAKELIALKPDIVLAHTTPVAAALQRETSITPIVFISVSDPIGSGFVASLGRPGGNLTGVLQYEGSITGKWLGMLKEIAPGLKRATLLANPKTTAYEYFRRSAEAVAPSLGLDLVTNPVANPAEIERAIDLAAKTSNSGLVLPPDSTTVLHRELIVTLVNRYRLPAIYALRVFVTAGGLISYDTNQVEAARLAATYVDRILRGAKPGELPVQAPTKYQTVLNLKTATTLGLSVPSTILVAADEVIE